MRVTIGVVATRRAIVVDIGTVIAVVGHAVGDEAAVEIGASRAAAGAVIVAGIVETDTGDDRAARLALQSRLKTLSILFKTL